jgi:RluA family pseudouridine synthase
VHRLDVGTSGLVLVARTPEAHRALATALARGRIEKRYLALVWGHPRPRAGVYDVPLGPDRRDRRRMKADPAGRPARSRYRTLADARHVSLVELSPETGRTHQLRVHLAHAGHWIVGDDLYGGPRHRAIADPRLRRLLAPAHPFLHAWTLALPETAGSGPRRFTAPLPPDFAAALDGLGLDPGVPWGEGPDAMGAMLT